MSSKWQNFHITSIVVKQYTGCTHTASLCLINSIHVFIKIVEYQIKAFQHYQGNFFM